MKLYATVTSERASKGQGGNEFLDLVLTYKPKTGEPFPFLTLEVFPMPDGIAIAYKIDETTAYLEKHGELPDRVEPKGKQQKGEKGYCWICGSKYGDCEHKPGKVFKYP